METAQSVFRSPNHSPFCGILSTQTHRQKSGGILMKPQSITAYIHRVLCCLSGWRAWYVRIGAGRKALYAIICQTCVWDVEKCARNVLHPLLILYRGIQTPRIHPVPHHFRQSGKRAYAMSSKNTKRYPPLVRLPVDCIPTYLILGFFNIMFAWPGTNLLLVPWQSPW